MKRGIILLIFISAISAIAAANAQQKYDASLIPKELLPYASAVIREQVVSCEVKSDDEVIYRFKQAVTILNKNGDEMAAIELAHDKDYIIKSVKGIIYNEAGIPTGKFSEADFGDVNTDDGFSLFKDVKVKHYMPAVINYPYTVEYEYEQKVKQTLNFDDWQPNFGYGVAVENSSYSFTCKNDFKIRYKELNLPSGVSITQDKEGLTTYSWKINNLKAIKGEPYSPYAEKYSSILKIAPVTFNYDGLSGSFNNWNQLGKWISDKLLANRQTLPDGTTDHVKELIAGITDPKLKAKKIYEYMQGKTRYISVQVGIGGYQPFLAADVDRLNYGDCKALVNYTQALLKAAGVDSWYCVVQADNDKKISMMSDFASMEQGNHIILCLPFKNDTTWCDCTSQITPFGYLGTFTDDRTVLACTPDGGKLMHTPKYTAGNNLQDRKGTFVLSNDGDLSGDMTTTFRGVEYDSRDGINDESKTDQLKLMQHIYPINNMDIEKLEIKQDKNVMPVATEKIALKAHEYAAADNGKINFLIDVANRMYEPPRGVINRKTDVYINEGYTETDNITYTLPAGYRLDSAPLNISVKKQFGTFTATSTMKDGKLIYKRELQVIDGTYPKDSYQDLVDFFQQVVDADAYDVILQRTAN